MKKVMVMFVLGLSLMLGGCGNVDAAAASGMEAAENETEAANQETAENETEAASQEAAENETEAVNQGDAENGENGAEAADGEDGAAAKADAASDDSSADKAAKDSSAAGAAGEMPEDSTAGETAKDSAEAGKDGTAADGKTSKDNGEADKKDADSEETAAENTKEEKKEPSLTDYEITAFGEPQVMYASNPVNVRKGPTTDFERMGGLSRGQEVSVTGQADSGWYEIVYGDGKAYVSDKYLQQEKPAEEEAPVQQAAADGQPQAVTEVKNVAGVIMVGDSRFVQMQENIGANSCTWIAENGKGYNWLNENAVARIDSCVGKGSKILINLGVNDPGHVNDYIALVNAKAAEWVSKGAKVYYASVNPVWENPYTTEEQVEYFNSQMQAGLSGDVHWIDSHSYLNSIGYKLVDGLHFNAETYQNIYAYFMSCL